MLVLRVLLCLSVFAAWGAAATNWPALGAGPAGTFFTPDSAPTAYTLLGYFGDSDCQVPSGNAGPLSLPIVGGKLYVPSTTSAAGVCVYDYNRPTSQFPSDVPLKIAAQTPLGGVTIDQNRMYGLFRYSNGDTFLRAYSLPQGNLLWELAAPDPFATHVRSVTVADGMVFLVNETHESGNSPAAGELWAVDALTGSRVWMASYRKAIGYQILFLGGITYGEGKVFVQYQNWTDQSTMYAYVDAYDARTGAVLWKHRGPHLSQNAPITFAPPIYAQGRVYAGLGHMLALDANTGTTIWDTNLGNEQVTGLSYGLSRLFVAFGTSPARVVALSDSDGTSQWSTNIPSSAAISPMILSGNGFLYLGAYTATRHLLSINAQTGAIVWDNTPPQSMYSQTIYNTLLYLNGGNRIYVVGGSLNVNIPPVARIDAQNGVLGGLPARLDGSTSSDEDGAIVSYQWTRVSAPVVGCVDAGMTSVSMTVTCAADAFDALSSPQTFRLTVTDNQGATATRTASVMFIALSGPQAPVANAQDATGNVGSWLHIFGSGTDADGTIVSYSWSPLGSFSGCMETPAGALGENLDVRCATPGDRVYTLTVTDNDGLTGTDTATASFVDVSNPPSPTPTPIPIPGSDTALLFLDCPRLTYENSTNVTLQCISGGQACPASDVSLAGAAIIRTERDGNIFRYELETALSTDYSIVARFQGYSDSCMITRTGTQASAVPELPVFLLPLLGLAGLALLRRKK